MVQQDPDQGKDPSQKSELWVSYDDEAVYFAAKFHDTNPDSIMARLVRRDWRGSRILENLQDNRQGGT